MTQEYVNLLESIGIPENLIKNIKITTSPGFEENEERGNISIGYKAPKGWKETAFISLPDIKEMDAFLRDREKVSYLLSLGLAGIPPEIRPWAPDWIKFNKKAASVRDSMKKASKIADKALGQTKLEWEKYIVKE